MRHFFASGKHEVRHFFWRLHTNIVYMFAAGEEFAYLRAHIGFSEIEIFYLERSH